MAQFSDMKIDGSSTHEDSTLYSTEEFSDVSSVCSSDDLQCSRVSSFTIRERFGHLLTGQLSKLRQHEEFHFPEKKKLKDTITQTDCSDKICLNDILSLKSTVRRLCEILISVGDVCKEMNPDQGLVEEITAKLANLEKKIRGKLEQNNFQAKDMLESSADTIQSILRQGMSDAELVESFTILTQQAKDSGIWEGQALFENDLLKILTILKEVVQIINRHQGSNKLESFPKTVVSSEIRPESSHRKSSMMISDTKNQSSYLGENSNGRELFISALSVLNSDSTSDAKEASGTSEKQDSQSDDISADYDMTHNRENARESLTKTDEILNNTADLKDRKYPENCGKPADTGPDTVGTTERTPGKQSNNTDTSKIPDKENATGNTAVNMVNTSEAEIGNTDTGQILEEQPDFVEKDGMMKREDIDRNVKDVDVSQIPYNESYTGKTVDNVADTSETKISDHIGKMSEKQPNAKARDDALNIKEDEINEKDSGTTLQTQMDTGKTVNTPEVNSDNSTGHMSEKKTNTCDKDDIINTDIGKMIPVNSNDSTSHIPEKQTNTCDKDETVKTDIGKMDEKDINAYNIPQKQKDPSKTADDMANTPEKEKSTNHTGKMLEKQTNAGEIDDIMNMDIGKIDEDALVAGETDENQTNTNKIDNMVYTGKTVNQNLETSQIPRRQLDTGEMDDVMANTGKLDNQNVETGRMPQTQINTGGMEDVMENPGEIDNQNVETGRMPQRQNDTGEMEDVTATTGKIDDNVNDRKSSMKQIDSNDYTTEENQKEIPKRHTTDEEIDMVKVDNSQTDTGKIPGRDGKTDINTPELSSARENDGEAEENNIRKSKMEHLPKPFVSDNSKELASQISPVGVNTDNQRFSPTDDMIQRDKDRTSRQPQPNTGKNTSSLPSNDEYQISHQDGYRNRKSIPDPLAECLPEEPLTIAPRSSQSDTSLHGGKRRRLKTLLSENDSETEDVKDTDTKSAHRKDNHKKSNMTKRLVQITCAVGSVLGVIGQFGSGPSGSPIYQYLFDDVARTANLDHINPPTV